MNKWLEYYEAFCKKHPLYKELDLEWYPGDQNELIIQNPNGGWLRYDGMTGQTKSIEYSEQIDWDKWFAVNLRRMIYIRGTTQTALAKKVGISRQLLNQYANGRISPSLKSALHLANALDCTIGELLRKI